MPVGLLLMLNAAIMDGSEAKATSLADTNETLQTRACTESIYRNILNDEASIFSGSEENRDDVVFVNLLLTMVLYPFEDPASSVPVEKRPLLSLFTRA